MQTRITQEVEHTLTPRVTRLKRRSIGRRRTLTVIVDQLLAPTPGGTGRVTAELTAALIASAPSDWRVRTVCSWHRDISGARIGGVAPRRLPIGRRVLSLLWSRGLPPWLAGDAVLAPTPLFPPRRPRSQQRVVVVVHDAVPYTHPETLTPHGVRWHRAMIARAAGGAADVVVVPSHAVADELRNAVEIQVPVTTVGWGVGPALRTTPTDGQDAATTAVQDRELRAAVGVPDHYLLFVGTLEPRKGLDVLIAALGSLHSADREIPPLVVVGPEGWGDVRIADLVAAAGVPDAAVLVVGYQPDATLAALLRGAAMLIAPSSSEGFGLPVLEAMSVGTPVVVSEAAALVELAGDAGVVVPVGDSTAVAEAIDALLADADRALVLAENGRRRAENYSFELAAERIWPIITRGSTSS